MAALLNASFLCLVIHSAITLAASTCKNSDPRCPCLNFTYKMAPYEKAKTCFQYYYGAKTWKESNDYCRQQGGRLAMLNDGDTFQFVRSTLNAMRWNTNALWIGGHDLTVELRWFWTNKRGEPDIPMTFTFWAPEHPEGWFHSYKDCVLMKKDGGQWRWHEAICHAYPFEYKFICEYEMKNVTVDANNPNGVGGMIGGSSRGAPSTPTTRSPSTGPAYGSTRHRESHGTVPRGENRKVTGPDNFYNSIDGFGQVETVEESSDNKDKHVPMYVVVIAFACGSVFALFIVLFFVLRRRRRRKSDDGPYPCVEYHASTTLMDPQNLILGGAVGGIGRVRAPVCGTTGKLCKVAVDVGAEACACTVDVEHSSRRDITAVPNVYVAVGGQRVPRSASDNNGAVIAASRLDSALDSSISTIDNNEAPPSYDEVCADILQNHITSQVGHEPHEHEDPVGATAAPVNSSSGAKPKTPKKVVPSDYMPMDGSASNSPATSHRNSRTSNTSSTLSIDQQKDTSQYIPMDRGELPPIPTDEGYEIPVSCRLSAESERLARVSLIRPDSITTATTDPALYAEIPDRISRTVSNEDDERIYSSID